MDTELNRRKFKFLLLNTLRTLKNESESNPHEYLKLSGDEFEKKVFDIMKSHAEKPLEVNLESGKRFPDIIVSNYYGVEVKKTTSNCWKSIGNSVAEGTRVKGIEEIFILFGKLCDPIGFKCRSYEKCLDSVVVTHSPRYSIDMNLKKGETFYEIDVSYNELRKQENPIKTIVDYYRKQLKPGDTAAWWIDTNIESESKKTPMIMRFWQNLSEEEIKNFKVKSFCLFPEILSNRQDKFLRIMRFLFHEGVIVPNIRDQYTSGGIKEIKYKEKIYPVSRIVKNLTDCLKGIKDTLRNIETKDLKEYWNVTVNDTNIYEQWCELIVSYCSSNSRIKIDGFPLREYLCDGDGYME